VHYLPKLENNEVFIFHMKLSFEGEGIVSALITLSEFFDGKPIANTFQRIILIRKDFDLHVLGVC